MVVPSERYNVNVALDGSPFTFTMVTSVLVVASSAANGKTNSGVASAAPAPSISVSPPLKFRKNPVSPLVLLVACTQPLKSRAPKISPNSFAS